MKRDKEESWALYAVHCLHFRPQESISKGTGIPTVKAAQFILPTAWHGAVVCEDKGKSDRVSQQHGTTYIGMHLLLLLLQSYHVNDSGLWPFVFYSLATVYVYQQSAPSLLQQLAAVTITSRMRRDSCEVKAGDLSECFPILQSNRLPVHPVIVLV